MPKFIVGRMERHCQPIEVIANNEEDAIDKVLSDSCTYEDSQLEYVDVMDPDTWTVERVSEVDHEAPLMLSLFHGRNDPEEDMEDWGNDGPIFMVYNVQVTYLTTISFASDPDYHDIGELYFFEDLVYYDGVFYGDWSVFANKDDNADLRQRAQVFNQEKADKPADLLERFRKAQRSIKGGRKLNIPR